MFKASFNRKGSIYTLAPEGFTPFGGNNSFEYVSEGDQAVIDEDQYPSVFEYLKGHNDVKLYFYPELPSWASDIDVYITILEWGKEDLKKGKSLDDLFKDVQEKHPKLLDRVKGVLESQGQSKS